MSTELAPPPVATTTALALPKDQLELVRRTVFPGSSDDELALYVHDCQRQGVHPLDRLIHPTVRTDKSGQRRYTPITSIDLMRSRAEATGEYAGNDEPIFKGEPMRSDFSATVTVWKIVKGVRCPFTATARWGEYVPKEDFMWRRMPHTMLGKCAEALALRKAFPRNLAGLYAREEMAQAENEPPAPAPSRRGAMREAEAPPPDDIPFSEPAAPASVGNGTAGMLADLSRYATEGGGRADLQAKATACGLKGRSLRALTPAELTTLWEAVWPPKDEPGANLDNGEDPIGGAL